MACVTAKCVCPICCGAIVLLFISSLCINWEYSPRFYETSVLALSAERRELQWSDPGYLAMCLIVKDQPLDVLEWIEYHRKLGATKFYVFDHNSTVPLVKQLYAYIEAGVLEYQYFREYKHESKWAQSWAYDSCIARFASYHRWMAFIDTGAALEPVRILRHGDCERLVSCHHTSCNILIFDSYSRGLWPSEAQ